MDPLHPQLQALLAAGDLGRQVENLNRIEMSAGSGREATIARDRGRAAGMRGTRSEKVSG
jgi:hypothetical protein